MGRTVSCIIPSRNDQYLNHTIEELLNKASGSIEILPIIDGPTKFPLTTNDERVRPIYIPKALGMRNAINVGVELAQGDYLMKIDSHCAISRKYDRILQSQCEDNWLVIARRNELSSEWTISDRTPCDYWYLSSPWTSPQGYMRDCRWIRRGQERADIAIDETMTISGSMWFMPRVHFTNCIGRMDDATFGPWSGEPQELACKTWLSGGRVMVNKNVVYAHMRGERGYHIAWKHALRGLRAVTEYWATDSWPKAKYPFSWLIDHFWPLPLKQTRLKDEKYFWESDWKEKYYHAR